MDYGSEVKKRFLSPNRAKGLKEDAAGVVSGESADRTLNVWIRFQIQAIDGVICAVRFNVYGCPYTVATVDWVAEWLEGRPTDALLALRMLKRREELGVPVDRLGKLLLIEDAAAICQEQLERLNMQNGN
jgi:NifU-like protein involved in Fe-S cluster formation